MEMSANRFACFESISGFDVSFVDFIVIISVSSSFVKIADPITISEPVAGVASNVDSTVAVVLLVSTSLVLEDSPVFCRLVLVLSSLAIFRFSPHDEIEASETCKRDFVDGSIAS